MSIEVALQELTAAVKAQTLAFLATGNSSQTAKVAPTPEKTASDKAMDQPYHGHAPEVVPPAAAKPLKVVPPLAPTTYEDVKAAFLELIRKVGREEALACIGKIMQPLPNLKAIENAETFPGQYANVLAQLRKVLAQANTGTAA